MYVKSLLLRLAVTALWFLYLAKVPCEGWVASPGVPSSSLENWWACQPPPSQTKGKKKNKYKYAGPAKAVLPELLCQSSRLLLGREASGAGQVGRDHVRQDVFQGRCGRKEEGI